MIAFTKHGQLDQVRNVLTRRKSRSAQVSVLLHSSCTFAVVLLLMMPSCHRDRPASVSLSFFVFWSHHGEEKAPDVPLDHRRCRGHIDSELEKSLGVEFGRDPDFVKTTDRNAGKARALGKPEWGLDAPSPLTS